MSRFFSITHITQFYLDFNRPPPLPPHSPPPPPLPPLPPPPPPPNCFKLKKNAMQRGNIEEILNKRIRKFVLHKRILVHFYTKIRYCNTN